MLTPTCVKVVTRYYKIMQAVTDGNGNNAAFTMASEVRFLPPWAKSQLAHILEVTHGWREIMGRVPSMPWVPGEPIPEGLHYPRKYTSDDIQLVAEECARDRREGFEVLLEEWGTSGRKRPTLQDLVNLLEQAKLYRAVDYLTVKVLNGEPQSRDQSEGELFDELERAIQNDQRVHQDIVHGTFSVGVVKDTPDSLLTDRLSERSADDSRMQVNEEPTRVMDLSRNVLAASPGREEIQQPRFNAEVLEGLDSSGVPHFRYSMLKQITQNFSDLPLDYGGNKLGEGAFGVVYLAKMYVGGKEKKVAVKKLNSGEARVEQQFKTEIEILSRCIHENLLPLEGYSCDGPDWCLVYTYMSNGSLQDRLACLSGTEPLDWTMRTRIGEGAARGIVHLHTFQERPLVHRDIKSANILLDDKLVPKVGDFGLVRLGGSGTHTRTLIKTTTVFGTSAYMAPEAFRGDISVKMDTFSFGIVILELLTGLPSYDEEREGCDLLSHVLESEGEKSELLDVRAGSWDPDIASQLFDLAELCTDDKRRRPTMVQVLENYSSIVHSQ
ncbi:uncharacterized protein [Penaeus vannamei]|uniref:uncharacterized protein isoform X2 n=1 Tax=Penaeus vannamei TaxID=6689 RepID=UPI00387F749B